MEKIKKLNEKHWLIILGMTLISIILLVIGERVGEGLLQTIIDNVAVAILISGVIGFIDQVFMSQSLIDSICGKVGLKKDIDNLQILNITTDVKHDIDYRYYIKKANAHIDIIHAYGRTWTKENIEYILDNILDKETKVRVLLVDPNSDLVKVLALQYRETEEETRKKIIATFDFWKEKCMERKETNNKFKGTLEIYYTKGNLNTAFYRMDDFLMSIHINSNHSSKANVIPGIIMKKGDNKESLYSVYSNEMEELFKESSLQWSLKEI